MRITKANRVVINFSGSSDFYDGALVAGNFMGSRYYDLEDVRVATGMTRDEIAAAKSTDMLQYSPRCTFAEAVDIFCTPVMERGHIIK